MKVVTWNVNSLRVRLTQLLDWLVQHQPDIVALQEIKLEDKDFPVSELEAAGYHYISNGQKTYNGVAFLSRAPLSDIQKAVSHYPDPQRRVLMATSGDIRIINLYVPNGSSVDSDKYIYKLQWLENLTQELTNQFNKYQKIIVLGDFNIAPEDRDVHDPKAWEGNVLVSEKERAALQKILKLNFHDAFRLIEQAAGFYSWWDYRAAAYRRDHGLRIDHILISEALKSACKNCYIEKTPRGHERPSDHAPVVIELEN